MGLGVLFFLVFVFLCMSTTVEPVTSKQPYRILSLCSLGFLVLLIVGVRLINPTATGGNIRCPVNKYLGIQCPGCGSLRATHSLLQGDIISALKYNWLAVVMLPVLLASTIIGSITGKDKLFNSRYAWLFNRIFIVVLIFFTVARNIN